ncbi:MAG: hypothetical protein RR867_04480 [Ruthenibacterium sp.]
MCFSARTMPRPVLRRILKQDLPALYALYQKGGRDFAWASVENLQMLFCGGRMWGIFCGDLLCVGGGICDAALAMPLCDAFRLTGLVPPHATLLLPPFFLCAEEMAADFFNFLAAQVSADTPLFCLIPVKSGKNCLVPLLSARFVLTALRPLYELRPHYIFTLQAVKKLAKRSIIVTQTDTWTLSYLLENGYRGAVAAQQDGVPILYLEQDG